MTDAAKKLESRERRRVDDLMANHGAVFVFGSNIVGVHGAGAAREAARKYGARRGIGLGHEGRSYAIPTKANPEVTLPLRHIRHYVKNFLAYAVERPHLAFAVTRIGCGFAGYTDADIAPMFADAPDNCDLPEGWRRAPSDGTPG